MVQQLHLRDQFEAVLKDYQVNQQAIALLQSTPMVLMAGLTGSGRNTIISKLEQTGKYTFVKSDTTRAPRIEHGILEKDGGPYWFKTEEQFLDGLKAGNYLEAAIIHNQQVSGLSINEIKKASDEKQVAITEVTPEGIATYSRLKPDVVCIFVLPPSAEVWLARLAKRSNMHPEELARRQQSALEEIDDLLNNPNYRAVVNDDLETTVKKVRAILEDKQHTNADQHHGLQVARDIKQAIAEHLAA